MIEILQKQMQSVAWQAKSIPYGLKSFCSWPQNWKKKLGYNWSNQLFECRIDKHTAISKQDQCKETTFTE